MIVCACYVHVENRFLFFMTLAFSDQSSVDEIVSSYGNTKNYHFCEFFILVQILYVFDRCIINFEFVP